MPVSPQGNPADSGERTSELEPPAAPARGAIHPSMPAAHQPHRPRSLSWVWILALAMFCALLVAAVWIVGPAHVFPSDPAESPSATSTP
jgi:hypothetical protein